MEKVSRTFSTGASPPLNSQQQPLEQRPRSRISEEVYDARMISQIEGDLVEVGEGRVELRCGQLTYQLLVPAVDLDRLGGLVGQTVHFHTLHFLEIQGQGSAYLPRMIGFASPQERAFFELLTTVKGLGRRKALRALQLPFSQLAQAIVGRDVDLLVTLPEIGKRTAETIVAELKGKLDRFIEVKPDGHPGEVGAVVTISETAREAVAVLIQLGDSAQQARLLVERTLDADPSLDSPDAIVEAAFRLKALG